jgi:transcriptional regulator with XRE-family HTH domain
VIFKIHLGAEQVKAFWYNEERKNVCGINIRKIRKEKGISIQKLSIMAELAGYGFLTANAITKAELGIRFIPDYEVSIFAKLLDTTPEVLLDFQDTEQ